MTTVSSHLVLREVPKPRKTERPLVILFPWLQAKSSAISRYCDLYHQHGLDVLTVKGGLKHFLMPATGVDLARELLNYITNAKPKEPLLIHAFSVGAYIYTLCFMEMLSDDMKYGNVRERIQGQILDSIVYGGRKQQGLSHMGHGIATAATPNPVLSSAIKGMIATYFLLSRPFTVKFYEDALEKVWEMPIKVPTLLLYAQNDPMCCPEETAKLVTEWQTRREFKMTVKCWPKSIHAAHLMMHKDEYQNILYDFLLTSGVTAPQSKI